MTAHGIKDHRSSAGLPLSRAQDRGGKGQAASVQQDEILSEVGPMIATPDLSHIPRAKYEHVYEPAEDTFALLDALEADAEVLRNGSSAGRCRRARLCVEIGSGSGCVTAFLSKIIGETEAAFLCTDINPEAAAITALTGDANGAHLSPVLSNLLTALQTRLRGQVDLLVFNPPYVPTSAEEEAQAQRLAEANPQGGQIAAAWAGGSMGTRLLDMIIHGNGHAAYPLEEMLSPGGAFYFVAIRQNAPERLVDAIRTRGLACDIVLSRRAGGEHLFILRAVRSLTSVA